jgi:hypothetical protein
MVIGLPAAAQMEVGSEGSLSPEDRQALIEAAEALLPYQRSNGSWPIDPERALGSPVTYGVHLVTYYGTPHVLNGRYFPF